MTRRQFAVFSFAVPLMAKESDKFEKLANDYIAKFLEARPEAATFLGEHRYDGRLSDVSAEGLKRNLAAQRQFLKRTRRLNTSKLDPVSRIDLQILKGQIESAIWSETVLREREWNPMSYNPGGSIYFLLEREFAPLPARLEVVRQRLDAVPAYLAAARANLRTSTKIHAETAIGQIGGTINLLTTVLDGYLAQAPESRAAVSASRDKAVAALKDWREWLQKELVPRADKNFRLGPELFRAKLQHTLGSALTADQIRRRGEADLKQTQAAMYETSLKLGAAANSDARAKVIRATLDKLAESRPDASSIVDLAKRDLVAATDFVRSKGLVSLFDSPLRIVEMPEFQRGVAVASCASPGPLEKNGVTFFNISPPPSGWNQAQVDSYFREYNNSMTKNLVVHEAMPGHYLQRAHANRFQAPTLTRAIFGSGTFLEGWAVYAEKVMANAGFGGPEVRMQQLKMRLRTIINALIDQGIHAQKMTEQQAMDLMMNEGFQEKSEAAGKWRRAQLTSTQLSTYYAGTTELDQLREDYENRHAGIKDQKAFHDRMLSFGSPAPRYVRELMGL
ncbi:MAG: DUF885 domain-containing protein [Bryobacteraceae bacterium]|nr:DUF885 domain-containing protein [Bryobacteraceae bacterium]